MVESLSFLLRLCGVWLLGFFVVVAVPYREISKQGWVSVGDASDGQRYPEGISGLVARGKEVYISEGCQGCHTQFVRGPLNGDIARGWGSRRTVGRDYYREKGIPLGWYRLGPDLCNVGWKSWRNEEVGDGPSISRDEPGWLYSCLIGPKHSDSAGGEWGMPEYTNLFKVVPAANASEISLSIERSLRRGVYYEPSAEAKALVAYLRSLRKDVPLQEAGPSAAETASK